MPVLAATSTIVITPTFPSAPLAPGLRGAGGGPWRRLFTPHTEIPTLPSVTVLTSRRSPVLPDDESRTVEPFHAFRHQRAGQIRFVLGVECLHHLVHRLKPRFARQRARNLAGELVTELRQEATIG